MRRGSRAVVGALTQQHPSGAIFPWCPPVLLSPSLIFGSYFSSYNQGSELPKETIDFGFKEVPRDQKVNLVAQVFSNVASSYDVMNDLMSGGLHRVWKDQLVNTLQPFPGMKHLDVAGGTGDVAFRILRAIRAAEAQASAFPRPRSASSPQRPQPASAASEGAAASSASAAGSTPSSTSTTSTSTSSTSSSTTSTSTFSSPSPSSLAPISTSPVPPAAESDLAPSPSSPQTFSSAIPTEEQQPQPQQSTDQNSSSNSNLNQKSHLGSGSKERSWVPGSVVVCDINPQMLEEGRKKAAASKDLNAGGLEFEQGNAESLSQFLDNHFDAYTIAFGIRNVTDRQAALREAFRVLKPGGRFLCLEFSQVSQPLLRQAYDAYSFAVIPQLGGMVAGDRDSYQYLVESIRQFPNQDTFAGMIEEAGFSGVGYENILGGVVALHSGFKLPSPPTV